VYEARGGKAVTMSNQAQAVRPARTSVFGSTVLWISSSNAEQASTEDVLSTLGLTARWVSGASQALYELRERPTMLCLLDCTKGGEALRVARTIRTERPQAVLVGIVDPNRPESSLDAFRAGVFDVLPSPIVPWDLSALISNAQDLVGLSSDQEAQDRVQVAPYGVFGSSPAMRKIIDVLPRVSPSRCPILL
jgi:DNA-binding NtrC family response regulator